jgi:ABC-2 type transport system ATP-binding protein
MMQRLGLAQALLGSPDLLLLDEPTDGVDPLGRRHIRDLLLSLRHEGMTIFLNSHLLSEVELVCTRVAILHKGCLVKSGSIKELTGQTNQYRFLFSATDREKLSAAFPDRPLLPAIESDERLVIEIKAETPLVLNAEIDVFRAKELDILGIVPDYRSLESRFMEIIETLGGEDL